MKSKAWNILNEDEKSALMLSFDQKKTSWEAGEILDKSHYKYLEIFHRAKFFFTMFTEYFEKTGDLLIPKEVEISVDFRDFIHYSIEDRMVYTKVLKKLDPDSEFNSKVAFRRKQALIDCLVKLRDSDNKKYVRLYDMILDFDRWNNFRVLPEAIQEPSAFKRRNKARMLKHLKNLQKVDEFHLHRFTKKFKSKKKAGKRYYLPLVCDNMIKDYEIIPIERNRALVEYLSKEFKLYIFDNADKAIEYAELVFDYLNLEQKNSKKGQVFWPNLRKIIQKANNYESVNNIIPRRKRLENSFREIDFNLKSKKKISKKSFTF